MTDAIATITATLEGEQVETDSDVNRGTLTSLLGTVFDNDDVEVVVHDIHDNEQIEDIQARYGDRWDARVEMDTSDEDDDNDGTETYGFNPLVALEVVECPECGFVDLDNTDATGHYQCWSCLTRFTPSEAEFSAPGDDPRDDAADFYEVYA